MITLRGSERVRRGAALQDLSVVEDGAVLIKDGLIESVGTTRRLENLKAARGAAEIPVDDAVILPGLIDPSIRVLPKPAKRASVAGFGEQCLTLMRSCMQHGTLHAQVIAGAEQGGMAKDMAMLRQLAKISNHPVGVQRSWLGEEAATPLDELRTSLQYLIRRKLVQAIDISPRHTESFLTAAGESGLPVNLHWSGDPDINVPSLMSRLRVRFIACPCPPGQEEIEMLKQSPVPVVFSPGPLTSEQPADNSARRLVDGGAPLALSSGYHSRDAPTFNMQMTIALAVLRLGLTVEQAITAATINAAHALNLDKVVGSLEVGKRADLIIFNLSDYRELPKRWGSNHVGMAIRDGKILFNRTGWKVSAA